MGSYAFTVPSGATIVGIAVRLETHVTTESEFYLRCQLLNSSGSPVGETRDTPTITSETDVSYTLGSTSDLWGNSLTPAWVNSEDFGVKVTAYDLAGGAGYGNAYLDGIEINVYYTESTTTSSTTTTTSTGSSTTSTTNTTSTTTTTTVTTTTTTSTSTSSTTTLTAPPSTTVTLHIKFFPKYNDAVLIQHGDDQITDESGNVIGGAVESYQGAKTVQVLGDITFSERLIETLKTISFTSTGGEYNMTFRLRAEWGSPYYIDIPQTVRVVHHTSTGTGGAS